MQKVQHLSSQRNPLRSPAFWPVSRKSFVFRRTFRSMIKYGRLSSEDAKRLLLLHNLMEISKHICLCPMQPNNVPTHHELDFHHVRNNIPKINIKPLRKLYFSKHEYAWLLQKYLLDPLDSRWLTTSLEAQFPYYSIGRTLVLRVLPLYRSLNLLFRCGHTFFLFQT